MAEKRIAIIGTGAIGSAVARRFLGAGHQVVVWNRTGDRAAALRADGAVHAPAIGEAVDRADLVVLVLTDYRAVRECLAEVADERDVVVLCTGTPADARDAAGRVSGRYLDAGLQSGPESITEGRGTILYSGDRDAFDAHHPELALLGPPRFVSENPDAAAVWDLALFGLWYDAQLGLLRALKTAEDAGIDLTEFSETAKTQLGHVVTGLEATVDEMKNRIYPKGPATLIEHLTVLRHLQNESHPQNEGNPQNEGHLRNESHLQYGDVITTIERLIAENRGHEGLTAITSGPAAPRNDRPTETNP